MKLKGRQKQIYEALKIRSNGLTVIEAMELGLGTELRKNVTTLIRKGYNIKKEWQYNAGRKFMKYTLHEEPKIMTITDPMTGNKQNVLF